MVGAVAMVEAVHTSTSTFGIWAIVVVAVVCLAVWLVGVSVADTMQARESRRWWRRLHASDQALAGREAALGDAGAWADPAADLYQLRGNVRGAELSAAGQEAADRVRVAAGLDSAAAQRAAAGQEAATSQEAAAAQEAVTEPIPAQRPAPESESEAAEPAAAEPAAARERHAEQPALDGAGDFRMDSAEADWRTDAPTRPDLPAQAAPTGTGRQAMPRQRTGDADRAERSLAGPDPAREDEDPSQE
jgi:hypothetical protein